MHDDDIPDTPAERTDLLMRLRAAVTRDQQADCDFDDKDSALARCAYGDIDTLTATVLSQLTGFACNPMIALDHDPQQLARVAIRRATAALRALTREDDE